LKGQYNVEDRQIVDLYFKRSETAITETDKKYGKYCHYIAKNILNNNEDAEEVVNDTYLKAWNTVPPREPIPLKPYVGMISRQLSLNEFNKRQMKKRGKRVMEAIEELSECIPASAASSDMVEDIALQETLSEFLMSLSPIPQKMFVRRYWYMASIDEISKSFEVPKNTVKVTLLRVREKLRQWLIDNGFFSASDLNGKKDHRIGEESEV
jgi:RNA polymerase sigma-70 factor (ECF subfamily)